MVLAALLVSLALAGDPPLAIPAAPQTQVPSPLPATPARSEAPFELAQPAGADLALRLQSYRRRAVSIREYSALESGPMVGWGFGSPFTGWGTTLVLAPSVVEVPRWAVFSEGRRLSVPEWMDLANAPEAREDLQRQIRRTRAANHGLLAATIVGAVSAVATSLGAQSSRDYQEWTQWRLASSLSTGVAVAGGIGVLATTARSRILRYDFAATQGFDSTVERVRAHNDALRTELGLTRAQTASIDRGL